MTRRKFIVFAIVAAVASLLVMTVGLLATDLYLHHRAERSAGLNRWGYRGPVLGRKRPGELRVAMLGGSTVFGYGRTWEEAIPALLEEQLNRRYADRTWRGVNLGYNTEGAFAFLYNLQDFDYLDTDVVCLYEGYNDLLGDRAPNWVVIRHRSPVFRLTGYFPMLPLAFREKAMMLRSGGDLAAGYSAGPGGEAKTVFQPNLATRTSAGALDAAAAIADSLGRQFESLSDPVIPATASETGCPSPWADYCSSVHRAVQYAIDRGKRVVVASQPRLVDPRVRERHQSQQHALAGMMARQFGSNPRVVYVDLAEVVDLSSGDKSFDQMHLSAAGNRLVAEALAEPVHRLAVQP